MSQSKHSVIQLVITYCIISIIYRIEFGIQLCKQINWTFFPFFNYCLGLGFAMDLALGFLLMSILFLFHSILKKIIWNTTLFNVITNTMDVLLLFIISLGYMIHSELLLQIGIGFHYTVLQTALQNVNVPIYYLPYMKMTNFIFLFSAFFIYYLIKKISYQTTIKSFLYIFLPFMLGSLLNSLQIFFPNKSLLTDVLSSNPILYVLHDTWNNYYNVYNKRRDLPSFKQQVTLELIDPLFSNSSNITTPIYSNKLPSKPMNIAIIVLESVGAKYIFDTSHGNQTPMPFLKWLAERSLWINNNYSTGNNSVLSGFGILSGLYPSPSPRDFEPQSHLHIPALPTWLGKQYDSAFITAGDLGYVYTKYFIINSFKNYFDSNKISTKQDILLDNYAPEPKSFDFFLSHFKQLKPPFFVVYWSGAAHMPYFDYGPKYRILNGNNAYSKYINNLNLLDHQIKLFYTFLNDNHLLDNTILVIVGDHGEGFNQHLNDQFHGTALYDEQIRTPLLFYQPKLFKPSVIHEATSSADILPTLLDALGLHYNHYLIQGKSLLRNLSSRKYLFIYGAENELAAINIKNNIKMIIDYASGYCKKYNLTSDPYERHSLHCENEEQEKAIVAFRNYQPTILEKYSAANARRISV